MKPSRPFEKVAIANRGEVAVRIIQACQELGIDTVLLHSEADISTRAFRLADEKICIGSGPVSDSYLNIEANIRGAKAADADAIHPGFGFLSENPAFAQAVEDAGMKFVGPKATTIRLLGDKISAKALAQRSQIPVIPGYDGDDQTIDILIEKVKEIGPPVIVKVAGGGGGRGLKVIRQSAEIVSAIESARREGLSSFGSDKIFLEKYFERAKHIEVQVFGDASGRIYTLGERECSVQRRHQKVIEEAPAAQLDVDLRKQIIDCAARLASEANYQNAGTVEFLVQDDKFYFLEMNTRLQVEHPVTELVWGVDLVKAQIQTAQGQALNWHQLAARGHAIECRLYAEDPYRGGLPSTGAIYAIDFPMAAGRRFDCGFDSGDSITSLYDPMLAKVIVWDETRLQAIKKMKRTLSEIIIFGVKTNIDYLQKLLSTVDFVSGSMTTRMIDEQYPNGLTATGLTRFERQIVEQLDKKLSGHSSELDIPVENSPWMFAWDPV